MEEKKRRNEKEWRRIRWRVNRLQIVGRGCIKKNKKATKESKKTYFESMPPMYKKPLKPLAVTSHLPVGTKAKTYEKRANKITIFIFLYFFSFLFGYVVISLVVMN